MSAPTNYLVLDKTTGEYNDLTQIFVPLQASDTPVPKTGFTYIDASGNQTDINNLFAPLLSGTIQLSYNTNMIALNGKDLTNVFAAQLSTIFTVDGEYTYSYDTDNKYHIVVFADYLSTGIGNATVTPILTFERNVTNVKFTLVGGGGGGGKSGNSGGGGGAGQGGATIVVSLDAISASTVFNITVGGGSAGGSNQYGTASTVSSAIISPTVPTTASGGSYGKAGSGGSGGAGGSSPTGGGAGGNGANYTGGTKGPYAIDGNDGTFTTIYTNSTEYYFGGGGGGGSAQQQSYSTKGGLGGGGGGGNGSGGNKNQVYNGPNGILYPQGSYPKDGWPGTGGGGSAVGNYGGGNGASGIVVCCFQLA